MFFAIRDALKIKNGRVNRIQFFIGLIIGIAFFYFFIELGNKRHLNFNRSVSDKTLIMLFVFSIIILIVSIVGRLHDLDCSGWWLILIIISTKLAVDTWYKSMPLLAWAVIGIDVLFFLMLLFAKGTDGRNRFGD